MTTRRMNVRTIAEFLVVGICTVAFVFTAMGICASVLGSVAGTDFVEYWASGHQLIHRANPYDGNAILRLERSVGFPIGIPVLIMWNLPSALLLVVPLGFLAPRDGELLWLLLLLACLVASVRMVWILHGRPKNRLNLLGYSFAPALACLLAGQVSLFVLLGLVLFLRLHRRHPLLAGVSLWLCMLKPHLFLPFGVVLVVWAVITRSYKVLIGVAVALGGSTVTAFLLDPLVWTHYRQMVSMARMEATIPCLSRMLQWCFSPNTVWLPYLPAVSGCVWGLAYFRKHRDDWDWMEHGSPLMLVSVMVAPYTWLTDQVILIPALLHGAYLTRSRSSLAILALVSAVIEIEALRGAPLLHSVFYLWTAPAWLAWYLCGRRASYATNVYDLPVHAASLQIPTVKH
jgi:Glycosyltransferase family 87